LLVDPRESTVFDLFEEVRKKVEKNTIKLGENELRFTVSIGVTTHQKDNLEEMISSSDRMLYSAKNSGRNMVVIEK